MMMPDRNVNKKEYIVLNYYKNALYIHYYRNALYYNYHH